MKFETLRMMAQDYADRHKEPSSLPATIDTMASAYQRICRGEDPWTALGDFSNAWYGCAKHIRPELVKEPLTRPEQETEHTRRWGAFCAASVEYLCGLHHQPCPEWAHDPSYILDIPWWYTQRADDTAIREHTRRTTPPPFARRNIFCSNRLYQNKYEMYEWIQEAIVKGMTDVHEIQRYARQKEISLYGAERNFCGMKSALEEMYHLATLPNGKPIDMHMLETAMEDSDLTNRYFLNLVTGEVLFFSDYVGLSDEDEQLLEEIDGSNDYVAVERIPSHEVYQWMVDFVDEIVARADENAAEKLSIALNGKGAFRRFKDTLHRVDDQWLQAWYQWRDKQFKATVDKWLKSVLSPDE